jgi:hypothetical protein
MQQVMNKKDPGSQEFKTEQKALETRIKRLESQVNKKKMLALPLSLRALLVPRDSRVAGDLRAQKYKS